MEKNQKYRIWFIQYDENGNEIGRGVSVKEYVYYGMAQRAARTMYGGDKRIWYMVAQLDPWTEHYIECFCDICGYKYKKQVDSVFGMARGHIVSNVDQTLKNRRRMRDYHEVCMECFDKVSKFVDKLKAKKVGLKPFRNPSEITFSDRRKVETVLSRMLDILATYGFTTVADFFRESGLMSEHSDVDWGWHKLDSAKVEKCDGGYCIKFPKPLPIK